MVVIDRAEIVTDSAVVTDRAEFVTGNAVITDRAEIIANSVVVTDRAEFVTSNAVVTDRARIPSDFSHSAAAECAESRTGTQSASTPNALLKSVTFRNFPRA